MDTKQWIQNQMEEISGIVYNTALKLFDPELRAINKWEEEVPVTLDLNFQMDAKFRAHAIRKNSLVLSVTGKHAIDIHEKITITVRSLSPTQDDGLLQSSIRTLIEILPGNTSYYDALQPVRQRDQHSLFGKYGVHESEQLLGSNKDEVLKSMFSVKRKIIDFAHERILSTIESQLRDLADNIDKRSVSYNAILSIASANLVDTRFDSCYRAQLNDVITNPYEVLIKNEEQEIDVSHLAQTISMVACSEIISGAEMFFFKVFKELPKELSNMGTGTVTITITFELHVALGVKMIVIGSNMNSCNESITELLEPLALWTNSPAWQSDMMHCLNIIIGKAMDRMNKIADGPTIVSMVKAGYKYKKEENDGN